MAGEIKLNDVSIATESGGTVTLGNATLGSTVVLGTNASPIASNLVLAAGNGIDFSAASGSAAGSSSAVLDDYEEGTWTPSIATSVTQPTVSCAKYGTYTKVGRFVYTTFFFQVNSVSSQGSGDLRVAGLPFNNDGTYNSQESPICTFFNAEPLGSTTINCLTGRGISSTQILISNISNTGLPASINTGSLKAGYLIGSFSYMTTA